MPNPPNPIDWTPTASLQTLRLRARFLQEIRKFFDAHDYWEVETPLLSRDTVVDAHIDPIGPEYRSGQHGRRERLFLQTSPEFGMKRLLAAGADRIFQISKVFRDGEIGARHNPEFTMLEWYRVGDTPADQMKLTEQLVRHAYDVLGQDAMVSLSESPMERMSYDDAFENVFGRRVLGLEVSQLRELAESHHVTLPDTMSNVDRDGLLNAMLALKVEPWLAQREAIFVYDYPASQSALAVVRNESPPVAERFELYLNGVEICNGYHELLDADELRRRNRRQNEIRVAAGSDELPTESRLLSAMEAGLPACAGVAVGIDRLLMTLLGKSTIAEVIAFPFERA